MVKRASREEGDLVASFATENIARSYEGIAESVISSLIRVVRSIVLENFGRRDGYYMSLYFCP